MRILDLGLGVIALQSWEDAEMASQSAGVTTRGLQHETKARARVQAARKGRENISSTILSAPRPGVDETLPGRRASRRGRRPNPRVTGWLRAHFDVTVCSTLVEAEM